MLLINLVSMLIFTIIFRMISYTAEVNLDSWLEPSSGTWTRTVAPSGLRSAALPTELSSQQGLEASFIHINYQVNEIFSRRLERGRRTGVPKVRVQVPLKSTFTMVLYLVLSIDPGNLCLHFWQAEYCTYPGKLYFTCLHCKTITSVILFLAFQYV